MTSQGEAIQAQEQPLTARAKIVQAARELVVEQGYDAVSTADVLARAGVSRGGLYHHFHSKQELMAAVLEAVEQDLIARLVAAVSDQPDPASALRAGAQWFLDECLRSEELQRAGGLEGRNALGWETWRHTITPYGLTLLAQTLAAAIDAGQIQPADPPTLAHLILAAVHEASALVISATDPATERARAGQALANLLDGLTR
jgi:AcrR family transcriptional regulator